MVAMKLRSQTQCAYRRIGGTEERGSQLATVQLVAFDLHSTNQRHLHPPGKNNWLSTETTLVAIKPESDNAAHPRLLPGVVHCIHAWATAMLTAGRYPPLSGCPCRRRDKLLVLTF